MTDTAPVAAPELPPQERVAELCVVIPVLNERDNIRPMVEALHTVLAGVDWEVLFVDDDSRDGTRDEIGAVAAQDRRVRLLHRIGRRGLSSAFIEGAQASLAPFVAAMDGDLQHDERLLPQMLRRLKDENAEIAIGSRYIAGGGVGEWDRTRAGMSSFATRLSQIILKTPVSDPMSGFFMVRRATFERAVRNLSAMGFKILLDIVASLPTPPRIVELPYQFRTRVAGESKLDVGVLWDFLMLIADKLVGRVIPVRFLAFAGVGAVGIAFHLIVLRLSLGIGLDFAPAQTVATAAAILGNFLMNNNLTFRDRRLKGPRAVKGLITFAVVCSVGAWANINVASLLFSPAVHSSWWAAGLAGAAMSLVWNYAVSSAVIWERK